MTSDAPPAVPASGGPDRRLVLRALREARGMTQDGWAGRLGVSRRTVQRWERGDLVPDAAMEAAIVELCRERALFRTIAHGPLAGLALTAELLGEVLAAARLDHRDRQPSTDGREDATDRPDRPAGPSSPPTVRSNLPAPVTRFIGRRAEIAQVTRLLGETRLLTLAGTGGCGKTRLACEVGRSLSAHFPDGVWLVELAATTDPALAPSSVASTLGVREEPGRTLTDSLVAFLGPKRLLLVLDNCEHLVAACARLADALLSGCPDLTVLATSRTRLAIAGETVWRVPSLEVPSSGFRVPGAGSSNSELGTRNSELPDAVRLFVDRARTMRPDFDLTDANASAVTQICRRLDGIPLAIELAAVRLNVLSVEGIAARLDDRFRLLNAGSRATLPRHQTLRSLIDWSYDLLDERERGLFERLAVFAGSFDLAAAEAVCGDGEYLLDPLAELADRSLVIVEQRRDEARYRLLETLRQYAHERLAARGDLDALQRRHRHHYLALAEEAEPALRGAEQMLWLDRLADEHDNLRAALRWCEEDPAGAEAGLRLARALSRFWEVRGHFAEGRGWLDRMLVRGEDAAPLVMAQAINAAGTLAYSQGDYIAAGHHYAESLTFAREADHAPTIAAELANLGLVEANTGDYETARRLLEEGLAIRRDLGDQWGVGNTLHNLAAITHRSGDFERARELYEECLDVKRALGDAKGIAFSINNLGDLALQRGEYVRARSLFEESLATQRALGNERGMVVALSSLGEIARQQEDYAAARSLLVESLALATGLGLQRNIAECLEALAAVAGALNRAEQGTRLLGAAHALRDRVGAPLLPAERERYDHIVTAIRAAHDEATFAAAWAQGRAMTLEKVIAQALHEEGPVG